MIRNPKSRLLRLGVLLAGLSMTALACGGNGGGGDGDGQLSGASFTVGSKEFTEQLILGQITIQMLEDAGASVDDQTGITGTTNVRKALTSGEIDMYWEYTGTGWLVDEAEMATISADMDRAVMPGANFMLAKIRDSNWFKADMPNAAVNPSGVGTRHPTGANLLMLGANVLLACAIVAELTPAEQRCLFHDNAQRDYRIALDGALSTSS